MTQVKEKQLCYLLIDISLLPTFHFLPPPYIFAPISLSSVILLLIMYLPPHNRFSRQNNNFARASHSRAGVSLFCSFVAFLLKYDVKLSNFTFKGGRK